MSVKSRAWLLLALAAALALGESRGGAEQPDAPMLGLEPGDQVPTFYVRAVSGPLRGKSVCYVCRNGDRPTVMILVRAETPELPRLLKRIDEEVDRHRADGLRAFGVFLAGNNENWLPRVQTLSFDEQLGIPLTIAATPLDGPERRRVPDAAAVTVVLYRKQRVISQTPFEADDLTPEAIDQVLSQVRQLIKAE